MKPSKLRRAMKHHGNASEGAFKLELARRAFNEGFGTTRITAMILASADCGGEDVAILRLIGEGQCGGIARYGMNGSVSHGMTRSPGSGRLNRKMELVAAQRHLRAIVNDSVRLEQWIEWGMILFPENMAVRTHTVNHYTPRPATSAKRGEASRIDVMRRLRALGPGIRAELRNGGFSFSSATVAIALSMIAGPSHRL